MANKQLTAKVRLNTSDVESKLKRLNTLFKNLDKASSSVGRSNNINNQLNQSQTRTQNILNKVKQWATNQRQVTSATKSTNTILGNIGSKLKGIAATYLGIMGAKAIVNTTDTITSAENRLNALNGGDAELTQLQMDKMYASAQKVRMSYADMISNASKSMTLAGDSFQGNMDNAIRFQEIMQEAYTLGGASAQEASTSMYQMIQALGSGTLAGDELRSVREGAPLAYKAIEKFAQGVHNTEDSLKDMASQGKITSDMVVAAIMNSGEQLDKQFEETQVTFGQAWNKIKNTAVKAFEPLMQKLANLLNSDQMQSAIIGIGNALLILADAVGWVFSIFGKFFSWCANNWSWLQYIVITVVVAIASALIYLAAVSVVNAVRSAIAWMIVHWQFLLIIAIIGATVAAIIWLANATASGVEFMITALAVLALAIVLIGVITGSTALVVIGIIIAVVALFLMFAQEIVGSIYWIGAVCANVGLGIANFCIALWNVIKAITKNIGVAFQNAWIWAKNTFWEFIADVIDGVSKLEPVINGIAKLLGKDGVDFGALSTKFRNKKTEYNEFVSVGDAWNSGINHFQYKDLSDSYDKGAAVGANIQNAIGNLGDSIKNKVSGLSLENIGKTLTKENSLPNVANPNYQLSGYDVPTNDELLKSTGDTADNTKKMADSMDLADDELDWLRKIAEMEWRNEFTTAEIKVDMTNHNNINGERDWEGMLTYLSDTLREEMTNTAYSVHY